MIEALIQWWRALARRERRMVIAAVAVVLVAVGYLLLFEPAWRGSRALEAELPGLRRQAAQMEAMAGEARRLTSAPQQQAGVPALRRQLESSVEAAGLKPFLSQVQVNGELIEMRFAQVPYEQWLAWVDPALREARLRVVDASVQREATAGVVSARLTLEGPKPEAR